VLIAILLAGGLTPPVSPAVTPSARSWWSSNGRHDTGEGHQ
jgi:hypothetical protein